MVPNIFFIAIVDFILTSVYVGFIFLSEKGTENSVSPVSRRTRTD